VNNGKTSKSIISTEAGAYNLLSRFSHNNLDTTIPLCASAPLREKTRSAKSTD
jgi:hypothetical protein